MIWLLTIPLPFALLCLVLPASALRRASLVAGAAAHFSLVVVSWLHPFPFLAGAAIGMDPLAHLFVSLISLLFLATSIYFIGYHQKQLLSQRIFLACMLMLLTALTLVCTSQHLGLLWVALEASSLAATPLIYFRLGHRALEATWKFLLMNSVGIALALLGIFCLAIATTNIESIGSSALTLSTLVENAGRLDQTWLRAGFLLAMVGFGTKMGLAPFHSWKPDAYGEAPPPVAAVLAGGMTLGAFIGILRFFQICMAAGQGPFAGFWMCVFGLLSIATAGIFIIGHNDYRRILAYTSVEHMGVLVLAVGLAGLAAVNPSSSSSSSPVASALSVVSTGGAYASMLHALHNTLNKGVLFFVVGFIWRIYRSNQISDVRGAIHHHPIAGILFLAGLCATTALPPFGMFYSEFAILLAAISQHQWAIAIIFAITMAVVFVGVMTAMLPMAFGQPPDSTPETARSPEWRWREPAMLAPAAALAILALWFGVAQPHFVKSALDDAASSLCPTAPQPLAIPTAPPSQLAPVSVLPTPHSPRATALLTNLEAQP